MREYVLFDLYNEMCKDVAVEKKETHSALTLNIAIYLNYFKSTSKYIGTSYLPKSCIKKNSKLVLAVSQ